MSFSRVVSIHGVPRSGTSWLGQIFNSHPNVAYRHQPLFAYRFKDQLSLNSTEEEVRQFLEDLYEVSDDDFILDRRRTYENLDVSHSKYDKPSHLVMKMVRYHHLIGKLLDSGADIVGIVRNPCAVINSWLQAPKEFKPGWDPMEEWRYAPSKNCGRIEEYNGFEKWREVACMFLQLQRAHSERFHLVRYEELVENTQREIERLFVSLELQMDNQVLAFIRESKSAHNPHPYAIQKDPAVKDRWRSELDTRIAASILREITGTELEMFLL